MEFDQKKLLKAFYSDGYQLGMEATQNGITQTGLFSAIEKMHLLIDRFLDSFVEYSKKNEKNTECKKGCEWCCYQPIFVLSYEMEFLNSFIQARFDKKSQSEIKKRAQQKNSKLSKLEEAALLNSKFPCPLLKNGACIAYSARPVACRIYLSTSLNSCYSFYKNPDDEKSIPVLADFPLKAGRMLNEGFKAALKASGLPAKEFRIEEILLEPPVFLSATINDTN